MCGGSFRSGELRLRYAKGGPAFARWTQGHASLFGTGRSRNDEVSVGGQG